MRNYFIVLLLFCVQSTSLKSQEVRILPYLQDAEPHSICILWETSSGEESIVEYGLTADLGLIAEGISYTSEGNAQVHEVCLNDLNRFTKYYYRVRTESYSSDIFSFKTPPFASDNMPFRIVAMSDMQRDGAFPNKFNEIVEEGVIKYLEEEYGGELIDNLALVMIPGDLVTTGNNYESWKNSFFNPSEKLFSHIPLYPVLGNHENNTAYYFTYFKLPDNGTEGFEEHWWYKDYGNTRLIGLNSNGPFDNEEQLAWFQDILDQTCLIDSIDFVFAQLHHPHKSELWTPGESDFTGEIIAMLEEFSTNCNKPSIHFFGHTHGYSRGQSRDHKHLWINVATAGGAIDNWGEFPNFDYDEFTVSQDEYGFVVVDIKGGESPEFTVSRISRGDQDEVQDNILTDKLTVRKESSQVLRPEAISPIGDEGIPPECITLKANSFISFDSIAHAQSHWQVTTLEKGFNEPIVESWKNFENWYYDIDTQAEDDLTDEQLEPLSEFTEYLWRVRYRDNELNWSEWSLPLEFKTGASIALPNLLQNPGGENDIENWEIIDGVFESLEAGICDGVSPKSGNKYFSVGGLCDHSDFGQVAQLIDLSPYIDSVETNTFVVNYGGYLSNYSGSDSPEMFIRFLDIDMMELNKGELLATQNSFWTSLNHSMTIPSSTYFIEVVLTGTRNAGTDNDSYFDDLYLTLGSKSTDCDDIISSNPSLSNPTRFLNAYPNPSNNVTNVSLPSNISSEISIGITNMNGVKFTPVYSRNSDQITFDFSTIPSGRYTIWLREKYGKVYSTSIVIQK